MLKDFNRFCQRSSCYINGTYYVPNMRKPIQVTMRRARQRPTTMTCYGLMAVGR